MSDLAPSATIDSAPSKPVDRARAIRELVLHRLSSPDEQVRRLAAHQVLLTVPHWIPEILAKLRSWEFADDDDDSDHNFYLAESIWRLSGDQELAIMQAASILHAREVPGAESAAIAARILAASVNPSEPLIGLVVQRLGASPDTSDERGFLLRVLLRSRRCVQYLVTMPDRDSLWMPLLGALLTGDIPGTTDLQPLLERLRAFAGGLLSEPVHGYADDAPRLRFLAAGVLYRRAGERQWLYPDIFDWSRSDKDCIDWDEAAPLLADMARKDVSVWEELRLRLPEIRADDATTVLKSLIQLDGAGWAHVSKWIDDSPQLAPLVLSAASEKHESAVIFSGQALRLIRKMMESSTWVPADWELVNAALAVLRTAKVDPASLFDLAMSLLELSWEKTNSQALVEVCKLVKGKLETATDADAHILGRVLMKWIHLPEDGRLSVLNGCLGAPTRMWLTWFVDTDLDAEFLDKLAQRAVESRIVPTIADDTGADFSRLLGSPHMALRKLAVVRLVATPALADACWADIVNSILDAPDDQVALLMPSLKFVRTHVREVLDALLPARTEAQSERVNLALAWLVRNSQSENGAIDHLQERLPDDQFVELVRLVTRLGIAQGVPETIEARERLMRAAPAVATILREGVTTEWEQAMGELYQWALNPSSSLAGPTETEKALPGYFAELCVLPLLAAISLRDKDNLSRMKIRCIKEYRERRGDRPGLLESKNAVEAGLDPRHPENVWPFLGSPGPEPTLFFVLFSHPVSYFRWAGLSLLRHWTGSAAKVEKHVEICCDDPAPHVASEARTIRMFLASRQAEDSSCASSTS